jgi:signal transduction histidine kinase/ligand-binding sensor domain-containing protein
MRLFFSFLLLFLGFVLSRGQIPELYFKSMPAQGQLSSNFTTCITQDKQGYIWIGTVDGLNRYDGHEMHVYRNIQNQYSNLPNNNIRTIFSDSKNRLWVGTIWGLSVYLPERNSFQLLSSSNDLAGIESPFIYKISETKDNEILVAAGKAIYKFDETAELFQPIIKVKGGDITTFHICKDKNIWVGQDTGDGLSYFEKGNRYSKADLPEWVSEQESVNESSIRDIIIDDSLLWIATNGKGIRKLDFKTKVVNTYLTDRYESFVVDLYQDNQGFIWSCDYIGLKRYDPETDLFIGYYGESDGKNNIQKNPIKILQDKQLNYWVLYSEKGFDFAGVDRGFQLFNDSPDSYWPLGDEDVLSVAEDANGNLWTGGFNGGVTVFHWKKDSITNFHFEPGQSNSLARGSIFDLHLDSNREMWLGTYEGGLQKYDPIINGFISYSHNPDDPKSINGNDIRSIEEDSQGNFWLAVHGVGVDYFDRSTGIFKHYTPENSGLSIEWTNHVILDSRDNLWVGTANGLNKMKAGTDTFKVYVSYDPKDFRSFISNDIICVHESPDNTLWIGTTNGLFRYNSETDDFDLHSQDFNNQYICSIEHDKNGNLWVSTHGGLIRYDFKNRQVFNFDILDGLQSNNFNINSSFFDGNSYLFFGGPGGLNVFNPDNIYYNLEPPKVVLTGLDVFNEPLRSFGPESPVSKHISVADTILLDYFQNLFTIKYTAINFINPSKNQYAYRLEGFEDRWNNVENKREATYTNLNPGVYTFRVKASNNDGIWNEEGTSIKIVILPPWYMTTWFRIGAVILLLAIIYYVINIRTKVLRRQKEALTALVNERTRKIHEKNQVLKNRTIELNQINRKLESQKETIEKQATQLQESNKDLIKINNTKDRLFSIIAHDVRAPFNTIVGFSTLLKEMAGEKDDDLFREYASYINESSNQVLALIENLLYWARSQTNEITLSSRKILLEDIFGDNLSLVRESIIKKSIELDTSKLNYNTEFSADMDMMRTVVRNLLSNAIKFTPFKGKITIISSVVDNQLKVEIEDTGKGIPPDEIEKIKQSNTLFSTPGTHGEKGSGLGLTLCNEFIQHHRGELIIESTVGKGSCFGFIVPLG